MKHSAWFYAMAIALCVSVMGWYGEGWSQGQSAGRLITLGVNLPVGKATRVVQARPGQVLQVELFGEDVKGAIGFRGIVTYSAEKLKFVDFTVALTIPGVTGLKILGSAGTVEVGGTTLEGAAQTEKGPLGVARFEVLEGLSGSTNITLKSATILLEGGRKDSEETSTVSVTDGGLGELISLDLDPGPLMVTEIAKVSPGQVLQVELFGEDILGAVGFRGIIEYDRAKLKYDGFTAARTIPGFTGLEIAGEAGKVEVGGTTVAGAASAGKGPLGVVRFEVLEEVVTRADITLKSATILLGVERKDSGTPFTVSLVGPEAGPGPVSPITPKVGDGTASVGIGDQTTKSRGNIGPGQTYDIHIVFNQTVEAATGFGVTLTFDPTKLELVKGSIQGGAFSGALDLPAQVKGNEVSYGAAFFGQKTTATGTLAVVTFKTTDGFEGDAEIELTKLTIRISGGSHDFTPGATVVLSSAGAGGIPSDFDGDGDVDFDDFFEFAAAFGQPAVGQLAKFDIGAPKDGAVGFEDFFAFAADFGKTAEKAGKAIGSRTGANSGASLSFATTLSGDELTARVAVSNVARMQGFSLVVSYEPTVLEYVRSDRPGDALLSRGGPTPLFLSRESKAGQVVIADLITGGGTASGEGTLANLIFRRIGPDGPAVVNVDLAQVFDGLGGVDVLTAAILEMPSAYALEQNYPNPFNPETQIVYSIPERADVRLAVYSVTGQRVAELVRAVQGPGRYRVAWDAKDGSGQDVASGIYFYRLEAEKINMVRKMALLR